MKTGIWKSIPKRGLVIVAGILLGIIAPACAQTTNADDALVIEATNAVEADVAVPDATALETDARAKDHGIISVGRGRKSGSTEPIVAFGQHVELKADETAEAVVVFGGTAKIEGRVNEAVVVLGGAAEISGDVGDAVAVGGSIRAVKGARIRGDAVAVAGGLIVEDGATVKGNAVTLFGQHSIANPHDVGGEVVKVLAGDLPFLKPLAAWFKECVFKLRPLAPSVGWVWVVAGLFFLLYALVALAFPRPVEVCVQEITQRPITTFLMGLLTKLLVPVMVLVLLATGIGVFIVPFLLAAVAFAGIVGKVALLVYFGRQITRHFEGAQQLLLALVVGWIIITLLYIVPVLGLLVFTVTGMWALGVAVMAAFGGARREMQSRTPPPSQPTYAGETTAPVAGFAPVPMAAAEPTSLASETPANTTGAGFGAVACETTADFKESNPAFAPSTAPIGSTAPALMPDAWALPRAGFWERMGAAFLDVVLVSILGGLVGGPPLGFLVALAYFAGMWGWKGTTIGGIVLKLKVVRLDGGPVTFPVALVRGLAAAFSTVVMFLGFLWIAWDPEKQSWHDKIAGTVVVRLPHTQSLVCF